MLLIIKMTKKIQRQPLWESSSRPLYPKCVWIEGTGQRNFIFDHDSHKRRTENKTKTDTGPFRKSTSFHSYEENEKGYLKLFGSSDLSRENYLTNSLYEIRQRPSVERHHAKTSITNVCLMKKQMHHKNPQRKAEKEAAAVDKNADVATQETKDNQLDDSMDLSQNQLTERVLQWLDLAGRQTLVRPESEVVKQAATSSRRIFTAEPNKQSAAQRYSALRRSESVHHLSLTFNDNESSLAEAKHKFRDANFIPNRSFKKTVLTRQMVGNVDNLDTVATSGGGGGGAVQSDQNAKVTSSDKKKVSLENVENQYRVMIQRQILESSCNTQSAKRQLHIFIPKLPKKQTITDCDSCLSSGGISKL